MTEAVWVLWLKEVEQDQEEEEIDCAWCMKEAGQDLGEGSHGICTEHAESTYQAFRASREVA